MVIDLLRLIYLRDSFFYAGNTDYSALWQALCRLIEDATYENIRYHPGCIGDSYAYES
jgi:hypothetical protein